MGPLYVEDFVTRWSTYYKNTGPYTGSVTIVPAATRCVIDCGTTPNTVSSVFQAVCQLFMWYSGDIDFQITANPRTSIFNPDSPTNALHQYTNNVPGMLATGWGARSNVVDDDFSIDWQYPDNGISFTDLNNWTRQIITVPFVSEMAATPTAMFDLEYNRNWTAVPLNLPGTLDQKPFFAYLTYPALVTGSPSIGSSIDYIACRAGNSFQLMGLLPLPAYRYWPMNTTVMPPMGFKAVVADVNAMKAAFPLGCYKKTELFELHRHILHPDGLDRIKRVPRIKSKPSPKVKVFRASAQKGKDKDKTK